MASNTTPVKVPYWHMARQVDGAVEVYKTTKGSKTMLSMPKSVVEEVLKVKGDILKLFDQKMMNDYKKSLGHGIYLTISLIDKERKQSLVVDIRRWYISGSMVLQPTSKGICIKPLDWPQFIADLRLTACQPDSNDRNYSQMADEYCDLLCQRLYQGTWNFILKLMKKETKEVIASCGACEDDEPGQEGHTCLTEEPFTLPHEVSWAKIAEDESLQDMYNKDIMDCLASCKEMPETLRDVLLPVDYTTYTTENAARLRYDLIKDGFTLSTEDADNHEPRLPSDLVSKCRRYAFHHGIVQRNLPTVRPACLKLKIPRRKETRRAVSNSSAGIQGKQK